MITDWTFYLVAFPAVVLLGLSKGGFSGLGMAALPLMALTIPPLQAAAIILPILMVQDVVSLFAYRKMWNRRVLMFFLPGALIGTIIATFLASRVSDAMVQAIVGAIAVIFVLKHWLRRKPAGQAPGEARLLPGLFWGSICGFTSFIANAGGVPFQAYTVSLRLPPAIYAASSTALFFILNWIKFLIFIWLGQVSGGNLTTSATLLPLAIVATLLGIWMVKRVSAARFYLIVTSVTFLLGLKLIHDGARGLGF